MTTKPGTAFAPQRGPGGPRRMSRRAAPFPVRVVRILAALSLLAVGGHANRAWAHAGHPPLPSHGATVDGDELLLSEAAAKAIDLQVQTVGLGDVRQQLQVNAHVELPPLRRAKVATLLSGRIRRVFVKPGDRVTRGEALASIESVELESLQTELLTAASELALLEKLAAQQKRLSESGSVAGSAYLQAQSLVRKQRAEFEIVKRKLQGWGLDSARIATVLKSGQTVDSITLTSPMAGVVEHIDTRPGELVRSTDHLFDVVDRSTVYLIGDVLEGDAHLVRNGAAVTVTLAGLPGEKFSGRIGHQRLYVQQPQRAIPVVVPVANGDGRIRPGMFGRMTITVAEAKQEVVCPVSALIETGTGSFVLQRIVQRKFKLQPVQTGMRTRTRVVIKSGLFPGQQVISRGTYLLASMFDGRESLKDSRSRSATMESGGEPARKSERLYERLSAARAVVEIPVARRAFATSLIDGRVVAISDNQQQPLHEGVSVKRGQVLARVRSQALRNMQLALLQANSRFQWTQAEVTRLRPVAEVGRVPGKELWRLEADLKQLRAQVSSLKRRLTLIGLSRQHLKSLLEFDLTGNQSSELAGRSSEVRGRRSEVRNHRQTTNAKGQKTKHNERKSDPVVDSIEVRAPIAGRISRFSVSPGELVHGHDKLFEIQRTDEVWIKAFYFERDAARIAVGREAVVTFPANPNLRLEGKVVRISPQLASKERVLPVWIEVRNPNNFLKEGMLAEVVVSVPPVSPTLADRKPNH